MQGNNQRRQQNVITHRILISALAIAWVHAGCTKQNSLSQSSQNENPTQGQTMNQQTEATELKIQDIKVGNGAEAKPNTTVSVHYTGWLTNGKEFDSSVKRGQPFKFELGAGQVIPGWDKGVLGMKVGGKRKLTIPPQLGYGERGAGGVIPPNSTLVFEVELIAVQQK